MKRKFVLIVLALVLAFGAVSVVNAEVINATISTNRLSNTSAKITTDATFDGIKDSCSCKITLQEKYNGSWRKATGVTKKTASKTSYSTSGIFFTTNFTLIKGKVYRVKVAFTDKKGSRTSTSTYYSGSF